MALSYRQVKDLYDQLYNAGATKVSLPEWSDEMNRLTGTDLYGQGLNDNFIKQGSVALDRALEWTGLPTATESFGRDVGALVGDPEAGAAIGHSLPRMTANFLPFLIPGVGPIAGAVSSGALAGAEAYTATGSPASGIVTGLLNAALPGVANAAEQAVLRKMGVEALSGPVTELLKRGTGGEIEQLVTKATSRLYPETAAQSAASFSAGQIAGAGVMEGQRWGEEYFSGQPLHSPFTTENLLNYTLGQLPFAGVHGINKLRGGPTPRESHATEIARAESLLEEKRAQDALREQTDIEKIPTVAQAWTPERIAELTGRVGTLRAQQEAITAKASQLPEDAAKLNELIEADNATPRAATATSALGAEQGGEHIGLAGKQIHETAKWRKILVADDPANPEELRGKVIEYSKGLREPAPTPIPGTEFTTFGVTADPLWRTVKTAEEEANRQARYAEARRQRYGAKDPATPELPEQATPATSLFDHITDLDRIEVEVDAVRTPAQKQRAILALRALQERVGLSEFSDMQLKRVMQKLIAKGETKDLETKATKARIARDKRALEAQAKRDEETRAINTWITEKSKSDPEGYVAFEMFSDDLEKRGARGATLVSSGKLNQMFYALRADPNAMERLKAQVEETLRTGKGLAKQRPMLDEVKEKLADNDDAEPVRNVVFESALQAIQNKAARQAFEGWDRKSDTNWDYEKRTFVDWVDEFGPPSKDDIADAAEFFADRDGVPIAEVKDELADFLERPHVKIWMETLGGLVNDQRRHAPIPQQILPQLPAGGPFVWGLAPFDEVTGKLGGKHTLPKSGELKVEQLKAIGGRGKPLQDVEIEMMRALDAAVGGGAFDKNGNVNVKTLQKVLKENPVVIEVHEYGMEGKVSEAKAELDQMTHEWLETLPVEQRNAVEHFRIAGRVESNGTYNAGPALAKVDQEKLQRYLELKKQVASEPPDTSPRATSYYNQISPFDTKKFPVVRVDVVLPTKKIKYEGSYEDYLEATNSRDSAETRRAFQNAKDDGALWPPDNLHENLPNTLGWAMVQFVPDPRTGEIVAFVGEQQSRWGQERHAVNKQQIKERKDLIEALATGKYKVDTEWSEGKIIKFNSDDSFGSGVNVRKDVLEQAGWNGELHSLSQFAKSNTEEIARLAFNESSTPNHPLLPLQHTLVLKAVIAEAAKRRSVIVDGREIPTPNGVRRVVISDSPSAMMTEGHDKAAEIKIPQNLTEEQMNAAVKNDPDFGQIRIRGNPPLVVEEVSSNGNFLKQLVRYNAEGKMSFADERFRRLLQEKYGEKVIGQEGGMRLHYDTTLPSAMRKLTGEEGERVEMGVHKNAKQITLESAYGSPRAGREGDWVVESPDQGLVLFSNEERARKEAFRYGNGTVRQIRADEVGGSPVFRNPDGTPKSSVTGLSFDISKATETFGAQGGFTLGDPTRAPQLPEPRRYASDVAAQQDVINRFTTDGHGVVRELLQDSDPQTRAVAKDLAERFPEALARVDAGVYEVPGSYAARRPSGRVGIFFDRSFTTTDGYVRNNVALHELLHGLTLHELANPRVDAKVVQELTNLRKRLSEALPKDLRAAYENAVKTEWYDRYARREGSEHYETYGPADMSDLHVNPDHAQLLYGLLNNEELVSQAFSARSMRNYMAKQKGAVRGQSLWATFTNWVKGFLGLKNVDGTALGDFISTTSQLLHNGEYLADFANFGERYLESKGQGGAYARVQVDRALGIVAESSHGLDQPLTIATALDFHAKQSKANAALRRARKDYERMLTNEDDKMFVGNVLAELGHKDIDNLVTSAIGEGQDISGALDLLPPEATNYVYERLRDAHDVLDVIRAASAEKNKGMVNLANPKLLRDSVAPVLKQVKAALAHEEFAQRMATELAGLSKVTPEGLLDSVPSFAPKAFEDFIEGTKDVGGKSLSALARFLEPTAQWARRVPEVAEAISKGFQLQANARKMAHEALKWLGMDTSNPYVDVLTEASVKETEKVLASPRLNDKVSQWMFWNNKKGKDAVTMLPENDPDVAKLLHGLSDTDRGAVRDVVAKAGKLTQMLNAQKLEKMSQIAATNGAAIAALTSGLKTRDNVALASKLLEGIQKSSDPMTSQDGMVTIQSVQQRMQPEAFVELYDFLRSEADKIKLWKQYFDANPNWATAQRTERYLVRALNKQGKKVTLQASTPKEAKGILDKKGYKLTALEDQWTGREDEPFAFPNLSPEVAKRMEAIEQNQFSMLSKALSPEGLAEVKRTSAVSQVLREATAQRSIPEVQSPARLLSQGAEELPWMWNHINWAQREANYWSRQLLRAQARTYLRDAEVRSLPEVEQKRLKTHFENLLMPDPKIAQQVTRLNSTWFLGYNLATSIINAAQPFVTHVSELTALTGKPVDSYRRVLRALDEVRERFGANPLSKFGSKDWASEEHRLLMEEAVKDGEVGIGMFDDEAAAQEAIAINFKRAMKKEAPQTLGQQLGKAASAYSTAGMWLFQHGERLNSRAALLAGFDYYREQGLSFKEAKEKAYEFNHAVNFGGGRAQRPVGAYSSRSPFLRGAAMLGTSLQSYVLGTTAQIARHLQRGFFRPGGLTPHETFAARRAAIQMLATQFAAAGLLGMPFVSGALALLDKAFPELELNRKTREGVNDFLSSDAENGNVLTDIAMTGVPSMFGWDMQSRLSMGNTLPGVSEVNGFQPENLLGPTANIVRNFVNGTTGFVKGDARSALSFLPPPVKKLIEAGQAALSSNPATSGIRDYAGRPLASPARGEELGAFLGFQPKRLSDQNAQARILKQSEEVLRTQESRFRQQQAEEVLKGNFGTVRQELQARMRQSKDYDAPAAVQAIARAAEELAFPRDLRREGTSRGAGARSALLATYGGQVGAGASEVQRLEFRKRIEQGLGLQGDYRQELKLAVLMDQLRLQNPGATRLELKSAAIEALGRASRGKQLLLEESQ